MGVMSYLRLARAGWVLVREGITRVVDPAALPPPARALVRGLRVLEKGSVKRANNAERLTQALNRLGPTYIKIGQFLATRPDIVGNDVAKDLSQLQDKLPAFGTKIARKTLEDAFARPVDEIFITLSDPIAAASIAQVHKATILQDGEEKTVAVKVLRPDIRQRFKNDLDAFRVAAGWIEWLVPDLRRLGPKAAIETHARSADLELDLRLEASALSELSDNMAQTAGYRTPDVYWEYMARDVLVTEWIDGIPLSDLEGVKATGLDLKDLARRLIQAFLKQAVQDGYFHADPHQGNLFVMQDGTIVAVDGGIMGRINASESRFLAEILWGFINRDYQRIAEVHFEAGYVPARHKVEDFAQALRGIGEPIHGVKADDISMARLLQQLLDVTDLFDMPLQPQLIFLQRTMVVAEGVSRYLDPNFNMWIAAEPVLRDWVSRHVGPAAQIKRAAEGLGALGHLATELPVLAARAEKLSADFAKMGEQGMRLDEETLKAITHNENNRTRQTAFALWGVAGSLVVLAGTLWWG